MTDYKTHLRLFMPYGLIIRCILISILISIVLIGCQNKDSPNSPPTTGEIEKDEGTHFEVIRIAEQAISEFDSARRKNAVWTGLGCALNTLGDSDQVSLEKNSLQKLEGYFLGKDKEDPEKFLFVLLGDKKSYSFFATTNMPRPDVAEYFNSPEATQTGYSLEASFSSV